MLRRKVFTFENIVNGERLEIKARSEAKAWFKLRRLLENHYSGPWGLTYNVDAFERALKKIRLIENPEESK